MSKNEIVIAIHSGMYLYLRIFCYLCCYLLNQSKRFTQFYMLPFHRCLNQWEHFFNVPDCCCLLFMSLQLLFTDWIPFTDAADWEAQMMSWPYFILFSLWSKSWKACYWMSKNSCFVYLIFSVVCSEKTSLANQLLHPGGSKCVSINIFGWMNDKMPKNP